MAGKVTAALDALASWFVEKAGRLALAITAAAFVMRYYFMTCCYLNADEASHFDAARAATWHEVYLASHGLAHPPLFVLVLHAVLFWGRTEPIIRLPSLIGGTAALWFAFLWLRRGLGALPALAGLMFMVLSPMAITASTQVRQYGLLLFFVCGALYATERAFAERSSRWAMLQGLFLLGAELSHYTALLVLACIGLYSWLRLFIDRMPRRMVWIILAWQFVFTAVLAWLYLTFVRPWIPFGPHATMDYLKPYYFAPAQETPLGFVWRAFSTSFEHVSGSKAGIPLMLAVVSGIVALFMGRTRAPRAMGLLVVSPFVMGFIAAIFKVFPFAGTRHQTYLLPFFAAGLAAGFGLLHRRLALPLLLLGVMIVPRWVEHLTLENDRSLMPLSDMTAALSTIHSTIPAGTPIVVDRVTRFVLGHYLSRNDKSLDSVVPKSGVESRLGGYRIVVPQKYILVFSPYDVLDQADQSARVACVPAGDPVWIVSIAWAPPSLASRLPAGCDCDAKEFGAIGVIKRHGHPPSQPQTEKIGSESAQSPAQFRSRRKSS